MFESCLRFYIYFFDDYLSSMFYNFNMMRIDYQTGHYIKLLSILFFTAIFLSGCMNKIQPLSDRNSSLTQGNVQLNVKVGTTTKSDVLENFGSPNITTRDGSGQEVWTYQRSAQVSQSSSESGYWTILIVGEQGRSSGFESSSRMITLIIKFDNNDVVSDFKSRTSNF